MHLIAHFDGSQRVRGWYGATLKDMNADASACVIAWDDGDPRQTIKSADDLALHVRDCARSQQDASPEGPGKSSDAVGVEGVGPGPSGVRAEAGAADILPPPPMVKRPSSLCCQTASKYYDLYESSHKDASACRRQLEDALGSQRAACSASSDEQLLAACIGGIVGREDDGSPDFSAVKASAKRLIHSIRTLVKKQARTPRDLAVLERKRATMQEGRLRMQEMQEGLDSKSWPDLDYMSKHESPATLQPPTRPGSGSTAPEKGAHIADVDGNDVNLLPSGFHLVRGDCVYVEVHTKKARPSVTTCRVAIQKALENVSDVSLKKTNGVARFTMFGPQCVGGINIQRSIISKKLTLAARHAGHEGWVRDFFLHLQV